VQFFILIFSLANIKRNIEMYEMFIETKVSYKALFAFKLGGLASAVDFSLDDIILTQLACPFQ
jgi:hypothetical protein